MSTIATRRPVVVFDDATLAYDVDGSPIYTGSHVVIEQPIRDAKPASLADVVAMVRRDVPTALRSTLDALPARPTSRQVHDAIRSVAADVRAAAWKVAARYVEGTGAVKAQPAEARS